MIGPLIRGLITRLIVALVVLTGIAAIAAAIVKPRLGVTSEPDQDEITVNAVLGESEFRSAAGALRGGTVTWWLGGGDLDLRDATLDPAGATLHMRIVLGGGRVLVPDEWVVELRLIGILGGVGDARPARGRPADAPRLVVEGFAALGGFAIMSSTEDQPVPELDD